MLLIDSDILIDAGRRDEKAILFLTGQARQQTLAISTITQLELLAGCRNKAEWAATESFIQPLTILPLSATISETAVRIFRQYRLAHGTGLADALIAATAIAHHVCLASKNERHFRAIAELDFFPYSAA